MKVNLYIDSDGTGGGTKILVIDAEGGYVGTLGGVQKLDYSLEANSKARVQITVLDVPGRFLAEQARLDVKSLVRIKSLRRWHRWRWRRRRWLLS